MIDSPMAVAPGARIADIPDATADDLQIGDYVHDDLAPFVVAGFRPGPAHIVVIVARLASGTDMTVRYPINRPLAVSRLVRTVATGRPARRHLTLVPPPAGGAQ